MDINVVRQYNNELKACKEQLTRTQAEAQVNREELMRLCGELTNLMGIQVIPENLPAVYQEYMSKIESNVRNGTEIINNIKNSVQVGA